MTDQRQRDARQRIVLVDDEEALIWSLSNRFTKQRPEYILETATDGHRALELIKAGPTDLLITDIAMESMSGIELILVARRLLPGLPVIVITAYPTTDLQQQHRQGSIEYLEKPFEFEVILRSVDEMLERKAIGFSGAISVQTLPDIIQLYALSGATGALHVQRRSVEGMIWFDRGAIVHASTNVAVGVGAFNEIMFWSGGEFSMRIGAVAPERSIRMGWAELLMESCRLMDELRREKDISSGPMSLRGWSQTENPAAGVLEGEYAAIANSSLTDATAVAVDNGSDHIIVDVVFETENVSTEESIMDYKNAISKLTNIDGFLGAAIVDSETGLVLASEGGSAINLEIAAAGTTEVVRANRKTMRSLNLKDDIEDILTSYHKQFHLIRLVKAKNTVFFYLVLDRQRATLAMGKLTLAEVEKDLSSQ